MFPRDSRPQQVLRRYRSQHQTRVHWGSAAGHEDIGGQGARFRAGCTKSLRVSRTEWPIWSNSVDRAGCNEDPVRILAARGQMTSRAEPSGQTTGHRYMQSLLITPVSRLIIVIEKRHTTNAEALRVRLRKDLMLRAKMETSIPPAPRSSPPACRRAQPTHEKVW